MITLSQNKFCKLFCEIHCSKKQIFSAPDHHLPGESQIAGIMRWIQDPFVVAYSMVNFLKINPDELPAETLNKQGEILLYV